MPENQPKSILGSKPVRLQLQRTRGFNLQALSRALNDLPAVNCARPGPCGNPFHHNANGLRMSSERAARHYRAQLMRMGYVVNDHGKTITREYIVAKCANRNLACFCKVDSLWCHVDTMLEVANGWPEPIEGSGFALELDGFRSRVETRVGILRPAKDSEA